MVRLLKYILLLLPVFYFSQKPVLIPVKIESKWGFMNQSKNLVISAQYDQAFPFSEYKIYDKTERNYKNVYVAKVYENKKMKCILPDNNILSCINLEGLKENSHVTITEGYQKDIDKAEIRRKEKNNDIISKFKKENVSTYDDIKIVSKNPLFFLVTKDEFSGIVNSENKIIVPISYPFIMPHVFTNLAGDNEIYFVGSSLDSNTSADIYFSVNGKELLKNYMPYFPVHQSGNLIQIKDKKGKYRIYNLAEKKYINHKQYDKLSSSFPSGFFLAERNGLEFYIDEEGKEYVYK